MILFPAIDLKNGQLVRLLRLPTGSEITPLASNPSDQARTFAEQGFRWLHVVDLGGAASGSLSSASAIEAILSTPNVSVQLGGGLRTLDSMEQWLEKGAARIMLGTLAQTNPDLVQEACRSFPGKIAISIDAEDGRVALSGWSELTSMRALDLALRYEDAGAAAIVYTDISRDGRLTGINIEAASDLAFALTTPLIVSGGLADLEEIQALVAEADTGIAGIVIGRALYDGRLDPDEALALAGPQI